MLQEPQQQLQAAVMASRPRFPTPKHAPQRSIDDFWAKFTTKHPGKIFTILPDNLYAKRAAAHAPKGSIPGVNALASYDQAVASCRSKVTKIVKECRRLNQKYRDPHFDIEADFKRSQALPDTPADCLTGLDKEKSDFQPMSVKRVEVRQPIMGRCSKLTTTGHLREARFLYRRRDRQRRPTRQRRRLLVYGGAGDDKQQGGADTTRVCRPG